MVQSTHPLAIDLHHVEKNYRKKVYALRGISMQVQRGEIFGLLGPNGAGKSTLVKIMMTVVRPTRAEGTILGHAVGHKASLASVGYLPEHHRFPRYLTGWQTLDYFGALSNVDRPTRRRRISELLDLVGMTNWADKKVSEYSKGMMQRIGLAQAMVNDPDLILLDEPTDGVDPVGRRDIRDLLLHLRSRGKTIFLNSHLLSELEMVCDRVSILVQGRVAMQGTVEQLGAGREYYEIEFHVPEIEHVASRVIPLLPGDFNPPTETNPLARPGTASASLTRIVHSAGSLASGEWCEIDHTSIRIGTADPSRIQPILDALRGQAITIRMVRPVRPSLEDLFMEAVLDPETGRARLPGAAPN